MKRRFAFQNKLFLAFIFGLTFALGFLGFKGLQNIFAVNSAYSGFKAGNIISDYVMSDYTSMSESDIQNFLKSHNSCNAKVSTWRSKVGQIITNYRETTQPTTWHATSTADNGTFVCMANESINGESAAHIIYQAARDYKINPKVLIVLLEKEQGLITDVIPNSFQYRSATGYGCPDSAACDSKYYGLKNQVRNAARMFRLILDNGSSYYPVGNNYVKYNTNGACGGSNVYIENRATSALYQYTPYQPNNNVLNSNPGTVVNCGAYGNANFYYYYRMWFGDTHTTVSTVLLPSSDTFTMQVGSGKYIVPEANKSGAKLIISSNASEANRQYKFTKNGNYYVITHVASGLVVDLNSADTSNGNYLHLYASNNSNAQKWRLSLSGSNYVLHSALADGKVFDVPGGATSTEGLALQIYNSNDSAAQNVTIKDVSSAPISNNTYVFETTANTKMMYVGGTGNGTRAVTANPNYNNNQKFTLTRLADGLYTIKGVASGKVLDVAAGSSANGAAVQLYASNNTCAQKWIVEKSGAGYRFLSSCSGKAIDIPGGATGSNNMQLQIYDANGSNAQIWKPQTIGKTLADGEYTISSALGKNLVVDISGGAENSRNGTNINSWTSNGTNAQKFKITYNESKQAYSIINTKSGRALDVSAASTRSGANVQVWESNGTCAQLWRLHPVGNTYNIISTCSDKVLDVSAASTANGANIWIYDYNNTNAQKWTFTALK